MANYKDYKQGRQPSLFPLNLSELIPQNHLVRQIDSVVDEISLNSFEGLFSEKGASSYHPEMMLKVIIYAFATKNFSSRNIAAMLRQDVTYMWLAGMQQPDFNTINRFRSVYLKHVLEEVFTEVLLFLHEHDYIKFETYFVDGSKLEADARKYSHVWRKSAERFKKLAQKRVRTLLREIDRINDEEDIENKDQDLSELGEENEISSAEIKKVAEKINDNLKQQENIKKKTAIQINSRIKKLEEESRKVEKYEHQQAQLGKRNSYSKTDPEATMMRMKGTNELRPGYNFHLSSENQFITNYSVSQNAGDSAGFIDHFKRIVDRGEAFIPSNYVGDGGYGSEENYAFLARHNVNSYFKYSTFEKEQKCRKKAPVFHTDNFRYDAENDCYICPNNGKLPYKETIEQQTRNGYTRSLRVYEAKNCDACPFKPQCTKSKKNRTIQVSHEWRKYKKQAKNNLESEKGIDLRKRRGWEIETFFGDLKHNLGYKRLRTRGLEKAENELCWLSISYNLRKLAHLSNKTENKKVA